ncbi:MAG: IS66-like element accessory protein TnpA [Alphaproteobacteria bacterium]|jgi:transposase
MMGLEIISGVERRRRWSVADKLRIVAEADEAGATVAEVARRHEISRSILWAWRKQARAGVLATPDSLGFLPVVVDAVSAMAAQIAASSVPSAPPLQVDAPPPPDQRSITITLANGTRLEIGAALSLPALSCIIGALR